MILDLIHSTNKELMNVLIDLEENAGILLTLLVPIPDEERKLT